MKIQDTRAYWAVPTSEVLTQLQTSIRGLSDARIDQLRKTHGSNDLQVKQKTGPIRIFFRQFQSPLIFILVIASILTIILKEWIDTGVIWLAIIVNTGLGFYQEHRAEQTLQKLQSYIKERTRVVRGGAQFEVDATELVPGDIVHLSYGARVPADARIISVNGLKVDEAILTGESLSVSKTIEALSEGASLAERTNMVYAGTLITEGYALAVVVATGKKTELGRIAELVVGTKRAKTPLQVALWKFGWILFGIVLIIVSGVFVLGVWRGVPLLEMLLLSSAVAVGAIPEALPIALTVILAVGVERLAARKGVMRSLSGAETLGSTTVIMTDKTGTLTEAQMRLVGIATASDVLSGNVTKASLGNTISSEQKQILSLALSNIDVIEDTTQGQKKDFIGKPLEINIARSAQRYGLDVFAVRKESLLPFNSTNKFSVARNVTEHSMVVLGAPDVLIARSKLSKDAYIHAEKTVELLSAEGNRLLGVAKIPATTKITNTINPDTVRDLEFMGLIILRDPVRAEVPAAIKKIEASGVKVVMITGDLKGTAISVAQELGWKITDDKVLTGAELRQMSDEELIANIETVKIFVRVTPEDKLRVAQTYKKLKHVVAMTGDGVNDAPSLKAVDIGVAIGSGSDVAKATAGLVLLDDNFKTIVTAIEEGRRILANIRKVFVYLMSTSLDEIILIGGSLLLGLPLPLTALQIIWVNFFNGSLPALAFAFDENYDNRKFALKATKAIFNREVTILTAVVGVLSSLMLLILYVVLLRLDFPVADARTILFACFSVYILAAAFSFKSLYLPIWSYPIFANKMLNGGVFIAFVLFSLTLFIAPIRNLFELAPASTTLLWFVPLWLVFNIGVIEFAKWGFRRFL